MIEAFRLTGVVDVDTKQAESGISRFSSGLGSLVAGAAKLATAAIAGVSVAGAGMAVAGVMAASDLEEAMNKVNVVFGESAGVIRAFSSNAAQSFGLSESAALSATGTFGNLFVSMGLGQNAAADMSQGVVSLAADLGSFNNLGTEEVLEKIRAGLVGEVEPLRSLGVNLNAADVAARAMAMGLAETEKELTAADKAQAAYALILEQTTTAQGDFERTRSGMANSLKIIRASFSDLSAEIGSRLLPAIAPLIASFARRMPAAIDRTMRIVDGLIDVVKGPLESAFVLARDSVLTFIDAIQGDWTDDARIRPLHRAIGLIATIIHDEVIPAARGFWSFVTDTLVPGVSTAFGGLVDVIAAAFRGDWGTVARTMVDGILGALGTAGDFGLRFLTWIATSLTNIDWGVVARRLVDGILFALAQARDFGLRFLTWLAGTITGVDWGNVARSIANGIVTALSAIVNFGTRFVDWLVAAVTGVDWAGLAGTVADGLLSGLKAIANFGQQVVDWIHSALVDTDWSAVASTVSDGLAAGISIAQQIGNAVAAAISGHDYEPVGEEIGREVRVGFDRGVEIEADRESLIDRLVGKLDATPIGNFAREVSRNMSEMVDNLSKAGDELAEQFGSDSEYAQAIRRLGDNIAEIGIPAAQGFGAAIGGAVGAVVLFTTELGAMVSRGLEPAARVLGEVVTGAFTQINIVIESSREILSGFVGFWQSVVNGDWRGAWEEAENIVSGWAGGVEETVRNAFNVLDGIFDGRLSGILGKIEGFSTDAIFTLLGFAIGGVQAVQGFVDGAVEVIASLPGQAVAGLGDLSNVLWQAGRDLVSGFIGGIREMIPDVLSAAGDVAGGAIDKITSFGRSPWPAMIQSGIDMIEGFIIGIGEKAPEAIKAAADAASAVLSAFKQAFELGQITAGGVVVPTQETLDALDFILWTTVTRLQHIASGFQEEGLDAANAFADAANAVLDAVAAAVSVYSDLSETDLASNDVTAILDQLDWLMWTTVTRLQHIASGFEAEGLESATAFAEAVGTIVDTIEGAAEAYIELGKVDADTVFEDAVYSVVRIAVMVVEAIQTAQAQLASDGLNETAAFADHLGTIVGIISDAADGYMALGEVDADSVFEDAVYSVVRIAVMVVEAVQTAQQTLSGNGIAATAEFAESLGSIVGIISDAADSYIALGAVDADSVFEDQVYSVVRIAVMIVEAIQAATERFTTEGLAAAEAFGGASGAVLGAITDAVDAYDALARFETPDAPITAALQSLVAMSEQGVAAMIEAAETFDSDGLEAAEAYADAAGAVLDVITSADSLEALADFTYTDALAAALDRWLAFVRLAVVKLGDAARTFDEDGLAAATAYADAASAVLDVIGGASDFSELRSYSGSINKGIDAFFADIKIAVRKLIDLGAELDAGLTEAAEIAASINEIMELLTPASSGSGGGGGGGGGGSSFVGADTSFGGVMPNPYIQSAGVATTQNMQTGAITIRGSGEPYLGNAAAINANLAAGLITQAEADAAFMALAGGAVGGGTSSSMAPVGAGGGAFGGLTRQDIIDAIATGFQRAMAGV